ncbi:bacteriohemerythrin [Clostridium sp. MT-14]|uniref:Hemerythrin family protein n=1 Tax=Clostridium aromativorans TaxID=2836848 RepID=A0ABS8N9S1_9CLOT|nr:hemerythrin family protein [Clostridium aromativorans]MCC9295458.1 hemerythrin family protein [Clostridium aromativorans]CAB1245387.1 Bacteriohemerythrin [Clostridiaceae bacterium BL-3]
MFDWKDEYSCGIKRIDDEHKKLFEIGNSIYELATNKNRVDYFDEILNSIDDLKEYTVYHFEDEEKIMDMYEYPGYREQKKVHDKFIEKIQNVDLEEIDENQQEAVLKLLDFVYNWITNHIIGMDLKIKDYFESLKLNGTVKKKER